MSTRMSTTDWTYHIFFNHVIVWLNRFFAAFTPFANFQIHSVLTRNLQNHSVFFVILNHNIAYHYAVHVTYLDTSKKIGCLIPNWPQKHYSLAHTLNLSSMIRFKILRIDPGCDSSQEKAHQFDKHNFICYHQKVNRKKTWVIRQLCWFFDNYWFSIEFKHILYFEWCLCVIMNKLQASMLFCIFSFAGYLIRSMKIHDIRIATRTKESPEFIA